jgi:hypothetical protein
MARTDLGALWRRLVPRDRDTFVPLADPEALDRAARRTRLVRLALAVVLVACIVGAFFTAPTRAGRRFIPADTTGVIVLDVSSSVKPDTYFRIEQTLATVAASRSRLGLVLFSDVAYEALPTGTPASELKPLLRFFAPSTGSQKDTKADDQVAGTPWEQWFSAGTKISNGLYLAAHMLQAQHAKRSAIILISDLDDDPLDLARLTDAVLLLEQRKIPLEIVGLDPKAQDADFFKRLLGTDAVFRQASLPTGDQARGKLELSGGFSTGLALCAVAAIVLLALNEWWTGPLRWSRRTA